MSSEQAWLLLSRARQKSHSNCRNVAELPASADVAAHAILMDQSHRQPGGHLVHHIGDAQTLAVPIKLPVALSTECHPVKPCHCAGIIAPTPSPKDAVVVIAIV